MTTTEITNAIRVDEFGSHNQYEMNMRRNRKNNIDTYCAHCAKAMTEDNGYEVRSYWTMAQNYVVLLPIDAELGQIRQIGSECIKRFLNAEQIKTHARRVAA